MLEKVDFAGNY